MYSATDRELQTSEITIMIKIWILLILFPYKHEHVSLVLSRDEINLFKNGYTSIKRKTQRMYNFIGLK